MKKGVVCLVFVMAAVMFSWSFMASEASALVKVKGIRAGQGQLYPGGNGYVVPALIEATGENVWQTASRWVALGLTKGTVAGIAATVIGIGGSLAIQYASEKFFSWVNSKGYHYDAEGNVAYYQYVGSGLSPVGFWSDESRDYHVTDCGSDPGVCQSMADALYAQQHDYPYYSGFDMAPYLNNETHIYYNMAFVVMEPAPPRWVVYCVACSNGEPQQQEMTVTGTQLESDITTDIESDNALGRQAAQNAFVWIENAYMNESSDPLAQSGLWEGIKALLDAAVTGGQVALVEAEVATDADTWAASTNPVTSFQMSVDVKSGVSEALNESGVLQGVAATASNSDRAADAAESIDDKIGEDVTPPTDENPLVPDKLSLTGVLADFWDSVEGLPIIETVQGINVTLTGATSQLCLNPGMGVGDRCFDASGASGAINTVGVGLLSIVTVMSVIGVFRG